MARNGYGRLWVKYGQIQEQAVSLQKSTKTANCNSVILVGNVGSEGKSIRAIAPQKVERHLTTTRLQRKILLRQQWGIGVPNQLVNYRTV